MQSCTRLIMMRWCEFESAAIKHYLRALKASVPEEASSLESATTKAKTQPCLLQEFHSSSDFRKKRS
jgi:hypothetical protein